MFFAISCIFSLIGVIGAWSENLCITAFFVFEKIIDVMLRLMFISVKQNWISLWTIILPMFCSFVGILFLRDLYFVRFVKK